MLANRPILGRPADSVFPRKSGMSGFPKNRQHVVLVGAQSCIFAGRAAGLASWALRLAGRGRGSGCARIENLRLFPGVLEIWKFGFQGFGDELHAGSAHIFAAAFSDFAAACFGWRFSQKRVKKFGSRAGQPGPRFWDRPPNFRFPGQHETR